MIIDKNVTLILSEHLVSDVTSSPEPRNLDVRSFRGVILIVTLVLFCLVLLLGVIYYCIFNCLPKKKRQPLTDPNQVVRARRKSYYGGDDDSKPGRTRSHPLFIRQQSVYGAGSSLH